MPKLKRHTSFFKNGHTWRLGNKKHHPTEPAVVFNSPTGRRREWWLRDKRHRVDGPAYLSEVFDLTNNQWVTETEIWCFKGYLHRADGPALIIDDLEEYWYMGAQFPHLEWLIYAQGVKQFPEELIGRDQPKLNLHPFETRYG